MNPLFVREIPAMTAADFESLTRLAQEHCGLHLPRGKESLVESRLGRILRERGIPSFEAYYRHLVANRSGEAMVEFVDALTTNHTSFMREPAHFDFLRAAATGEFRNFPSLRIWSAPCSSGEEPYSIAMTLLDASLGCRWASDVQITATDISTKILKKAQAGAYEIDRMRGVPESWRQRYFAKEEVFTVRPTVSRLVRFERLNLIHPFPPRRFHVIFFRNVMIYFNRATQQDIITRLCACVEPGGYVFIGHSETLNGLDHPLRYLKPAIYRR